MALNKQQQGMYLRKLFENKHLDVLEHCDLYNYLNKCGFEKKFLYGLDTDSGIQEVYRFFNRTAQRETYPEGTEFILMTNGQYIFMDDYSRPRTTGSFGLAESWDTYQKAVQAMEHCHKYTHFGDTRIVPIKPKVAI